MRHLTNLIAHLAWADDRVLAALRGATKPDPSCLEVFAHVLAAEHVWLARLQGKSPRHPVWPALSLEECAGLVQANQRRGGGVPMPTDYIAFTRGAPAATRDAGRPS